MNEQKDKDGVPMAREQTQNALREEIAGDVLELWIGISRLMARVRGSDHVVEPTREH